MTMERFISGPHGNIFMVTDKQMRVTDMRITFPSGNVANFNFARDSHGNIIERKETRRSPDDRKLYASTTRYRPTEDGWGSIKEQKETWFLKGGGKRQRITTITHRQDILRQGIGKKGHHLRSIEREFEIRKGRRKRLREKVKLISSVRDEGVCEVCGNEIEVIFERNQPSRGNRRIILIKTEEDVSERGNMLLRSQTRSNASYYRYR